MPEINSIFFTELRSELLESLKRTCEHDHSYAKVWQQAVVKRDPSHSNSSVDEAATSSSTLSNDELTIWKCFHMRWLLTPQGKGRVCVPMDIDTRCQILYECHDSPSAGHSGIRKTYALVRRKFYWPGLHKDVQDYVVKCQKCHVNKAERLKAGGLLQPLEIPQGKWESISMDFIVGLPNTRCGHDAICVLVDPLTKLCRFIPTKTTVTTLELARLFIENIYRLYGLTTNIGLPTNIVSDRDQEIVISGRECLNG